MTFTVAHLCISFITLNVYITTRKCNYNLTVTIDRPITYDHTTTPVQLSPHSIRVQYAHSSIHRQIAIRLFNKCMSTHLNANANVSLDSNANANANAIFQECIQTQIFLGRIQMQIQMCWLHILKCGFILTFCFIWRKNNVMYTDKLLI